MKVLESIPLSQMAGSKGYDLSREDHGNYQAIQDKNSDKYHIEAYENDRRILRKRINPDSFAGDDSMIDPDKWDVSKDVTNPVSVASVKMDNEGERNLVDSSGLIDDSPPQRDWEKDFSNNYNYAKGISSLAKETYFNDAMDAIKKGKSAIPENLDNYISKTNSEKSKIPIDLSKDYLKKKQTRKMYNDMKKIKEAPIL
jgi:hypothetical protein